jgi:hypothetical protein
VLRGVALAVFQIQTNGPGFDQPGDGSGNIAVATLEIRRNRDSHTSGDALDDRQHFLPGDALAVGIAHRIRYARAGGGDGREARFFEDARAHAIPGVRQDQNVGTMVQRAEQLRFFGRCRHRSILLTA